MRHRLQHRLRKTVSVCVCALFARTKNDSGKLDYFSSTTSSTTSTPPTTTTPTWSAYLKRDRRDGHLCRWRCTSGWCSFFSCKSRFSDISEHFTRALQLHTTSHRPTSHTVHSYTWTYSLTRIHSQAHEHALIPFAFPLCPIVVVAQRIQQPTILNPPTHQPTTIIPIQLESKRACGSFVTQLPQYTNSYLTPFQSDPTLCTIASALLLLLLLLLAMPPNRDVRRAATRTIILRWTH